MPELPEVESIRRNLIAVVKDLTIEDVNVYYRPIVSNDITFETRLKGKTIKDIKRKGKYLFFMLDDLVMVSHLRMEGKYMMDKERDLKHTHVEFIFKDHILQYHDTRKFGRFELLDRNTFDINTYNHLGKEPFDLTGDEFYQKIHKRRDSIKEILLNQSIIAGIGNIYANEILYRSKLHPAKPGFMIKPEEADLLIKQSKWVLDKAIRMGGTTIDTFESLGHKGQFQQELMVHGKEGETCPLCDSTIKKVQHGGRGTYYCEGCQKGYVIALTGGIATGKSSVAHYLTKKGFMVVDSDKIVGNLYQQKEVQDWLIKTFKAITPAGEVDKAKIASIVFSNKKQREKLEHYLHPKVYEVIEKTKQESFEYLMFLDIPLLFESGYKGYDKSLLITCRKELQLQRLMERNHLTQTEAQSRIKSQMPLSKKIRLADAVIENNQTLKDLYRKVDLYLEIF